jgi:hypothetical protein
MGLMRHDVALARAALMSSQPVHQRRGYQSFLIGRNTRNAVNEMMTRHEEALDVLAHPRADETAASLLTRIHEILVREREDRDV